MPCTTGDIWLLLFETKYRLGVATGCVPLFSAVDFRGLCIFIWLGGAESFALFLLFWASIWYLFEKHVLTQFEKHVWDQFEKHISGPKYGSRMGIIQIRPQTEKQVSGLIEKQVSGSTEKQISGPTEKQIWGIAGKPFKEVGGIGFNAFIFIGGLGCHL